MSTVQTITSISHESTTTLAISHEYITPLTNSDLRVVKRERFDVDAMSNLLNSDKIPKNVKNQLRAYKRQRVDGNTVQVVYEYAKAFKNFPFGRVYPQKGIGLQAFPSDVRACLAKLYYWDIDMVNAQPTILLHMCRVHGWAHTMLEDYVANREKWLADTMKAVGCSRHDAKTLCLSGIFGGQPWAHSPTHVVALFRELCTIAHNLISLYPAILKKMAKEPYPERSCVAHVLQDRERFLFETFDQFLVSKGRYVGVPIHDGGLVEKAEGERVFPETILREAETHLLAVTGFPMAFVVKPMEHSFVFSHDLMRTAYTTEREYLATREQFERVYFLCRETGTICSVEGEVRHYKLIASSFRDFNFKHVVDGRMREEDFLPIWLKDGDARTVERLSFYPDIHHDVEGINTFRGLRGFLEREECVEREAVVARFKRLIEINAGIVSATSVVGENVTYLTKWLAMAVQRPWERPGVAIILINADQGSGKDTLMNTVGQLVFGSDYYRNVQDVEGELFGSHSTVQERTLFMKLEEVNGTVMRHRADQLKTMITSGRSRVNPKGVGAYDIDTFPHLVMTTNNVAPVKVEASDRRFCIFYTSSEYVGNRAFWEETYRLFQLPGAGRALYEYLMSVDLTGFHASAFPSTEYRQDLMVAEVSSEELFIRESAAFTDWTCETLLSAYQEFCKASGLIPKGKIHLMRSFGQLRQRGLLAARLLAGARLYSKK